MKWRVVRNTRTNQIVLKRARLCSSFWCHFKGLQLSPPLPDKQGLLFVHGGESRGGTTIHMFFMRFSIGVVWMDANGKVVDKQFAKPWRPAYTPRQPAQYYIEANPDVLERVEIGDVLRFDEEAK